MKKYFTIIIATISLAVNAQEYYSGSENLQGIELRYFLHGLIDNHSVITYSNCITALKESDQ